MNKDEMILMSVDDHVIEPPDMFKNHLPKELWDKAPQFVTGEKGNDTWVFDGRTVANVGLNAVVGRPKEEYGCEPTSHEEMRAATYDIHKRIEDLNANGLASSLCFGTFVGFDGGFFVPSKDKANALRMVQAYNDWHVDEWCGSYPGRHIPLGILPLWDPVECVKEVERLVGKGCHAISFPDNPTAKGLPSIHNASWEQLWKVCNDNRVVVNCHIGTGYAPPHPSMESPINAWITGMPISIANSAADWIHLAALNRYPNLKIALSEGGIGWIPYFLERADFTFKHHVWTRVDLGGKLPSEVFREHFLTCFIDDKFGLKNYTDVGEDIICYECDYPHSDCTWPEAPEVLWESLKGLPERVINKVTHENVMREYQWDPISKLGREALTVGSLREQARAAGVDTQLRSLGGEDPTASGQGPVTSGDVVKLFQDQTDGKKAAASA